MKNKLVSPINGSELSLTEKENIFYSEFETSVKELKNSISTNKKEDTLEDLINELENN